MERKPQNISTKKVTAENKVHSEDEPNFTIFSKNEVDELYDEFVNSVLNGNWESKKQKGEIVKKHMEQLSMLARRK